MHTTPMDSPPTLVLSAPAAPEPARRFLVTARFVNTSQRPLRLLDLFEPLPVFFTARLVAPGGGEVDIAGAGKLDPLQGSLRYAELAPGAILEAALDLAPWLRASSLPGGTYRLSLQYHNAYGEDCFKGLVDSAAIEVRVGVALP